MKLYITGGGTGGHVTPGLAIARYFESKRPDTEVRFAGTSKGIESRLVPREGYPLDTIEITGLRRSFSPSAIGHNVNALRQAMASIGTAKKLLKKAQPDVVIGCGGYASFPVVSAAQKLGIPTVLLEVNAYPGITTKMLAKKADKVLICFEEARELVGGGDKVELTGSPVRGEIVFADRAKARQKLGLSDSDRLVVSFWGSMGAKYMNEHMAGMLALETKQGSTFRHIHATGSAAFQWLPKMACEQGAKLTGGNIEVTEYIYVWHRTWRRPIWSSAVPVRPPSASCARWANRPSWCPRQCGREPSGERACARACRRVRGTAGEGRAPQTLLEMTDAAPTTPAGRDGAAQRQALRSWNAGERSTSRFCRSCADPRGRTGRGFGMAKREERARAVGRKAGAADRS